MERKIVIISWLKNEFSGLDCFDFQRCVYLYQCFAGDLNLLFTISSEGVWCNELERIISDLDKRQESCKFDSHFSVSQLRSISSHVRGFMELCDTSKITQKNWLKLLTGFIYIMCNNRGEDCTTNCVSFFMRQKFPGLLRILTELGSML